MTTLTRLPKLFALAVALVGGVALPQSALLLPAAAAGQDLDSSTSNPFASIQGYHVQYILDSSHFTNAGINYTIALRSMRFRVDASVARTVLPVTSSGTTIRLSTAPIDYLNITTSIANNHGADLATVWTGTAAAIAGVTVAGVPGYFYLNFVFGTPFYYTPGNGDLTLEVLTSAGVLMDPMDMSTVSGQARAKRIVRSQGAFGARYNITAGETCPAVEFTYQRPGLFPDFSASPTSGSRSPMTVQFTDLTLSSAPGGVTSWAWDLNNDGLVDSTLQNPSNAFGGCTSYDVRLTVTDAWHGSQTVLKRGYVTVSDQVTAKFEWGAGPTPMSLAFTEMSCFGNPTGCPSGGNVAGPWEWDFDGDGITDSTARNPTWTFPPGCTRVPVRLRAWHQNCFGEATTDVFPGRRIESSGGISQFASDTSTVFLDLEVLNPAGVFLCGIESKVYPVIGPGCSPFGACRFVLLVDVYATDGSWHSRDGQPSAWWALGRCSESVLELEPLFGLRRPLYLRGVFAAGNSPYLPSGRYGLALSFPNGYADLSGAPGTADDGTLRIAIGGDRAGFFSGTFSARGWNGALRYRVAGSEATNSGVALRGPGCAGALGVPQLTVSPTTGPRLGQLFQIRCNRLPLDVGAMVIGFSGTTSNLGPLPFLLPYTFTCYIRNSLDISQPMPGAAHVGTWSLTLPNSPSLLGAALFHQVVVPDSSANALGLVLSDAYGSVIGR